jgi:glycosyltransferase involved in cell wall biosynthesis
VTPHGGLTRQNRQSKRLKKNLYVWLLERSRLRAASAITLVSPQEVEVVHDDVPDYRGIVRWVPNPVEARNLEGWSWEEDTKAKRLVFLGRFHIVNKGLDILSDIASLMPDTEFLLYGIADAKTQGELDRLRRRAPPNVHFHKPVFGIEKARALTNASLYIQTSRWEGFPLSVIEAMYLGVPCAIADTLFLAKLFRQEDLGLVFPPHPEQAATLLSDALSQPARLRHWSQHSREFARKTFDLHTVASKYLQLYEEVLSARVSRR